VEKINPVGFKPRTVLTGSVTELVHRPIGCDGETCVTCRQNDHLMTASKLQSPSAGSSTFDCDYYLSRIDKSVASAFQITITHIVADAKNTVCHARTSPCTSVKCLHSSAEIKFSKMSKAETPKLK
jgi:hypothetical protein